VDYRSPNWGGFEFGATYSTDGDRSQNDNPNAEKYLVRASYVHKYFTVHTAYEQENNINIGIVNSGTAGMDLPGTLYPPGSSSYEHGKVKNYVITAKGTPNDKLLFGGAFKRSHFYDDGKKVWERDAMMLMLDYHIGNFIPRVAWAHQFKAKNKQGGRDIKSADVYVAGFEYVLSKRTSVFMEYSYIDNNKENAFSTTSLAFARDDGTYKNPQTLALGILTNF
jgi:predicted porin